MLLKFRRYSELNEISSWCHVNPEYVVMVDETQARRSYGGYEAVTIILFRDGTKVTVDGHIAAKLEESFSA